jgi:tRNA-uridine 2-sulfurtransferase
MKIAVALSGGVDSTAVILKLRRAGHDVFGVTMQICPDLSGFPRRRPERMRAPVAGHGCTHCLEPCACADAEQTARQAGIRLEVIDLRPEFEREVIAPFLADFASGRTPNPCALCNRHMKFGRLAAAARDLGAEAFATGHYARLEDGGGRPALRRALDRERDQTYFLSLVPADRFTTVMFPLGETRKAEARQWVDESGWHVRPVTTSNEICFLKDLAYEDFLRGRRPGAFQPGAIVDLSGRVLGEHNGLPAFTVGQRKGLRVAAPEPLYVIRLEAETNCVVAGPDQALWVETAEAEDVTWQAQPAADEIEILAQIRYRQPPVAARLRVLPGGGVRLDFARPVRAVTPGQIAAFYLADRLLGGGILTGRTSRASL